MGSDASKLPWMKYFEKRTRKSSSNSRDGKHKVTQNISRRRSNERDDGQFHSVKRQGVCSDVACRKDFANAGKGSKREGFDIVDRLKACANQRDLDKGAKLHAYIEEHKFHEKDSFIASALINMYTRCGALAKARQVLEELPARDVVSWTALVAGYVQQGQGEEALKCFDSMQQDGYCPNAVTFCCALKACGSIGAAVKGEQIHDKIISLGMLENNAVLGNALVDMYARCGALDKAQQVLGELPVRDVITWTSLIAGYVQQGQDEEALKCFDAMQRDGHCPDAVTFSCALKACGSVGATAKGREIHEKIVSLGMLEKNVVLGSALVDMYARCGALAKAQEVFAELHVRNVITWTALITGYVQQGQGEEALKFFDSMQHDGHSPDAITFTCALQACGSIGAAEKGEQIHDQIASLGMLEKHVALGSTLVDMYARCGALAKAERVFAQLPVRSVVTWNALIGGYALQGQNLEALNCFKRMQSKGVKPDSTTFNCVLNACSHCGLSDKAENYFAAMRTKYGIKPDLEHYSCMVDMFGRLGKFNKAVDIIEEMPSTEYLPMWLALLGACRKWGEVQVGRFAFDCALHLDKSNAGIYISMTYIYTAAGMQEDADKIEAMRVANKAWKIPGCCWWTDATGKVHSFSVGDKSHAQIKHIYAKLKDLTGRMSQECCLSHELKMDMLCTHSEKLAISCALINTTPGTSILVVKNMRVCEECHRATAAISALEKREIKVRDAKHLHIFKDGKCSCGDYW